VCWNRFRNFSVERVEICLMAINLQRNFIKLLGSRLLASNEIHIITNYLHLNCVEYVKKRYNPPLSAWHTAIQWKSLLTWHSESDEIRVLTFDIHLICSEYGFKHNLHQIKKFQAWLTVYGLETRLENSDELIALQLEMQLIGNELVSVHVFGQLKMFVY